MTKETETWALQPEESFGVTNVVNRDPVAPEELDVLVSLVTEDLDHDTAKRVALDAERMTFVQQKEVLRKIGSLLAKRLQTHNSTDGINPVISKLSRHLQWRLARTFAASWKPQ